MNTEQPAPVYDALDFDGTERRANYRTIAYREDMLHICERKDAAAILYQILYRWQTEVRRAKVLQEMEKRKKAGTSPLTAEEAEDMMWVYMSYNDFVRESGGAVAYNTVIRMLDYLITTVKLVEQRPNHDPRYAGYEYRINKAVAKEKLKALSAEPVFVPKVPKKAGQQGKTSPQMGTAANDSTRMGTRAQGLPKEGERSTQKGRASTQRGTGVYLHGGTSHTYSHTLHRDSSQGDVLSENAEDAPTPNALSQDITQAGGRLHGMIPAAAQAVTCITGEPPLASTAQAIRIPRNEAESTGHEKTTRTPELSTNTATYPHPRAKVSPVERASGKKTATASSGAITLSPSARVIFDAWCMLFKVEVDLTPASAQAAEKLVKPVTVWCSALRIPIESLLKEIMNWLYATDKNGYYKRGVKLFDVSREFEGWQSAKERALQNKTSVTHIPTREEDPYSIAALLAAQNPGFFA